MFDKTTINSIVSSLSTMKDNGDGRLLWRMAKLIKQSAKFTFVSIFLVDENNEFIVMKSGSGLAGERMVQRGHKLYTQPPENYYHPVTNSFFLNKVQLRDYDVSYTSPDIGESEWQLAFPIRKDGIPIGVLEVEGGEKVSFQLEDTFEFQRVADDASRLLIEFNLI